MYHSISERPAFNWHPYYEIATTPARFAEQARCLRDRGYAALSLADVCDAVLGRAAMPPRAVAITFDDGYQDNYDVAWPVLREAGLMATFFLPTALVGETGRRHLNGRPCLTWSEARAMHAAGMAFGSHTVTHREIEDGTDELLEEELCRSKAALEKQLGAATRTFSYPYAFPETNRPFRARLRDALARCGFDCGVTTILGRACRGDDVYCLRRIPISEADELPLFMAKIEGGYDWMHGPQWLAKVARARRRHGGGRRT
jgi:peptidoglycan/xylan/chitin deacetylase (PgdA/CDA1 family)